MRLTTQQKAERAQYIGASEIPILVGCSPYKTKEHDLWLEKTGQAPYEAEEDDAQNMGHLLEPVCLQVLSDRIGLTIRPNSESRRHNLFTFRAATPDGLVIDRGELVAVAECKAPGRHMWHHWDNGVPDFVALQANDQCAHWHVSRCYVGVLLGNEVFDFVHEYSEELAGATMSLCGDWWNRYVIPRVPPPVDGSESADRMLKALFPRSRTPALASTPEAEELARTYKQAKAAIETHELVKAEAEQKLKAIVKDAEGMTGDGWRLTWKSNGNGAPQWKGIAEALIALHDSPPDEVAALIAKYTGAPSRPFSLKTTKKDGAE